MIVDSEKLYIMPQILGLLYDKESLPQIRFPQTETIAFQFHTEREAARNLLPDC